MKTSQLFFKTRKEIPSDCELISHRLMERAGLIKRLSKGIYAYTPLLWKTIKYLMEIIREEFEEVGCQELFLPQLQPLSLWKESGRLARYKAEGIIYLLEDREESPYCLGPTHEEVVTHLAKNWLTSYKQLPVTLYQIGNKFRDEIRPRFGLMRAKEFLMADAYSFSASEKEMHECYGQMRNAYKKIFDRLHLRYAIVEADSGAIGKGKSEEFHILAQSGEDALLFTSTHASNVEILKSQIPTKSFASDLRPSERVSTPLVETIEELCSFLGVESWQIVKTLLYRALYEDREEFVAVSLRGDRELNEVKLANFLQCLELSLADGEQLQRIAGVRPGFLGPKNLPVRLLADENCLQMRNFVVALNENDFHLLNANWDRDLDSPEISDFLLAREGDTHPVTGESYTASRGIEVGHIFTLGYGPSKPLEAFFANEKGALQPFLMGCYGIGIGRLAAAIIEQHHDERGICWPIALAPFVCTLLAVKANDALQAFWSEKIYTELKKAKIDLLWDDRDERLGCKIKDSDLLGIPYKLIIGAKSLEVDSLQLESRDGTQSLLPLTEVLSWARQNLVRIS